MDMFEAMNSNLENRKHGGESKIFDLQSQIFQKYSDIERYNFIALKEYLPENEKVRPGSLEEFQRVLFGSEVNYVNASENVRNYIDSYDLSKEDNEVEENVRRIS